MRDNMSIVLLFVVKYFQANLTLVRLVKMHVHVPSKCGHCGERDAAKFARFRLIKMQGQVFSKCRLCGQWDWNATKFASFEIFFVHFLQIFVNRSSFSSLGKAQDSLLFRKFGCQLICIYCRSLCRHILNEQQISGLI